MSGPASLLTRNRRPAKPDAGSVPCTSSSSISRMNHRPAHPRHAVHRVALYFAPAIGSPWWAAGCRWLGRDAASGAILPLQPIEGIAPDLHERLIAEPRRYGWHATLKAPFALRAGKTLDNLRLVIGSICAQHHCFELPPLRVGRLGRFLALRPSEPSPAVEALAAACVQALHPYAQAPSPAQLASRRQPCLSPRQAELLETWGYPYVLDQYRFHLTLSSPLDDLPHATADALTRVAERHFEPLPACRVEHLSVFIEPGHGTDFMLADQVPLAP